MNRKTLLFVSLAVGFGLLSLSLAEDWNAEAQTKPPVAKKDIKKKPLSPKMKVKFVGPSTTINFGAAQGVPAVDGKATLLRASAIFYDTGTVTYLGTLHDDSILFSDTWKEYLHLMDANMGHLATVGPFTSPPMTNSQQFWTINQNAYFDASFYPKIVYVSRSGGL